MRGKKTIQFRRRFNIYLALFLLCLFAWPSNASFAKTPQANFVKPAAKSIVRSNDSSLLETGNFGPSTQHLVAPAEIKFVSYNIRWRGGADLQKLIALLRNDTEIGGASIIGLQEVDRRRKRTGNVNTAQLIAQQLALNYAWAAPPPPPGKDEKKPALEEETGVAIFSPYPIFDVERIVLPNPGPGGRRRAAIGATIRIGQHEVRAYSIHAETRVPMKKKIEQLEAVIEALDRRPTRERSVVMGDFNTIKSKDVRACIKLFTEKGFATPIPHDRSTWKTFIIKLKLDWLWLRGFDATGHSIVRRVGLSDHWPIWVTVKL